MNQVPIAIDKARWWAISSKEAVFYGTLATNLTDVVSDSIPTAATDGKRILWNPKFLAGLTDEEVRFILLHETLHCAHDHFSRLPLGEKGNRAGDYAINRILQDIPGIKMPKGGLLDKQYDNLAEEEILARLKDEPESNGDKGGCGTFMAPATPDSKPGKDGKPVQGPTMAEQWQANVVKAAQAAQAMGQGSLPADMARVLEKVRAVDVDWRQEMADFVKTAIGTRNDYVRGSSRHERGHGKPVYPRRKRDEVGTVVVARDTSGSIDNALCAEFSAQLGSITADVGCEAIVLDCDTQINAEYRLARGEAGPLEAKGGGGTDFAPVFARVAELQDDGEVIAGVIYLTDGDGHHTDLVPDCPVLWAMYGGGHRTEVPFGRVIQVK